MEHSPRLELIPLNQGESFAWREFVEPRFSSPWHFHPEAELTYIRRGTGQLFVGDTILRFSAGDLFLFGGGLPHVFYSDTHIKERRKRDSSQAVVLQLLPDKFGAKFWEMPEQRALRALWRQSYRGIFFSARARPVLACKLEDIGLKNASARTVGLLDLLHHCSGVLRFSRLLCSESYNFRPVAHAGRRIDAVCRYVFEGYSGKITLAEAARRAAMNPASFCRYFHSVTGKRFITFVNEIRIGQVCRFLIETNDGVSEIAFSCGFESLSNFNRWFIAFHRTSPSRFRSAHRQLELGGNENTKMVS